jgi:glycosyltransferase involved in cell wall biosynthesis
VSGPLVTVVINNYNYGRFLRSAIESVLSQDYLPLEVVVVDDGSTDNSREVIGGYADSIIPVLKANGGQSSAFNAGVANSRGDVICFLDADDCFGAGKVRRVVGTFNREGLNSRPLLVHHRLQLMDPAGAFLDGQLIGEVHDSPLNLYEYARRYRSFFYKAGPTSGLSLNRNLIEKLFPLPEGGISFSADEFLVRGASLIGELYFLPEVLSYYRVHGQNRWYRSGNWRPVEFQEFVDEYLNKKLVENKLGPVLKYRESMHFAADLFAARNWGQLSRHLLRLLVKQHDLHTVWYCCKMARACAALAVRTLLAKVGIDRGRRAGVS